MLKISVPKVKSKKRRHKKKEIQYGDSELLKCLKDYNIEPSSHIKRKQDYYFAPYGTIYNNEKFMKFDNSVDEARII